MREVAIILDTLRRSEIVAMRNGIVWIVVQGERATPAHGAYRARGWMWPPSRHRAWCLRAQGCGVRGANGEQGSSPVAYAHHGRNRCDASGGGAENERPTTTTEERRRAAIKHGSNLRLKPWICCWLKLVLISAAVCGVGEQHQLSTKVRPYARGLAEEGKRHEAEREVPNRTGGVRFGEARNPGPPGGRAEVGGMTITTGNGTGWGTISDWLRDHGGDILCTQEHKIVDEGDIAGERNRLLTRGWKSAWSPATPSGTAANEASGGVAVFVRNHIGVEVPPGGEDVFPGQVAATMVEMAGLGWMVVYAVYGRCGEELGHRNWAMCQALANHALGHGLPWCAGGDWNVEPATLRASGWLAKMRATALTADVDSTTHAGGRRGRHIDFFVASQSIASVGPRLTVCADAVIRTHDAITMRVPMAPRQFTIRRMVRAKVFPRELPIGPRPNVSTQADITHAAKAALATGITGDREAAAILINEATRDILEHLEKVLIEAYMISDELRDGYEGRARGVAYAHGPLLGPKVGRYGTAAPTVRRMRALQDRAAALAASANRRAARLGVITEGAGGDVAASWSDLAERARAAIHTGHHVAAIESKRRGDAAAVCSAYAAELKALGKWAEKWALYAMSGAGDGGGGDLCYFDQVLHGCGRGRHGWVTDVSAWGKELAEKAATAAEAAETRERSERQAAVRKWANEASQAGAAMAHRWTKVPEEWRPETVEADVDGVKTVTANPGAVVEAERAKWEALWRPADVTSAQPRWGRATPLRRPTVEQFRRAARKFPRKTGIGVEGILPADFDALDDEGVMVCIEIMLACEAVGHIPDIIALVLVRLIPKRDGGRRPIGLLPSLYRIWAKIRAGDVRDWERKWARAYFAAGPGKSAEAAAWRSALRAELATASNASSASVLWDLLKCFEHGQHFLLAEETEAVEFPMALARMSSEMYKAERRLILDEAVSEAVHPTRGFMAGCARALALIKVLMIRRMDAYVARHPRVNLDWYVDDVELQAVGTQRIVQVVKDAATDLREVLGQLGFALAGEKARVIASSDEIAEEIVEVTGGMAGRAAGRAIKLGVELTSGRRTGRIGGLKRSRMHKALARQRRLFKFRAMGGAACKVVRRGVIPSTAFGSSVGGVSDAELRRIQGLVARTSAPNTRGASTALKLLLDGDPAWSANASTLYKWAEVAWDTAAPAEFCRLVEADSVAGADQAQHEAAATAAGAPVAQRCAPEGRNGPGGDRRTFRAAQLDAAIRHAARDVASGSWEAVRGPASAALLTARRIGWTFRDGTTLVDERGRLLDMARTAPSCVRNAVIRATKISSAAAAALRWGNAEFSRGIWYRPLQTAVGRLRPAARAALRRSWTGGYWSRARLADAGLVPSAECDKCGSARDDAYHRIWECEHEEVKTKREAATTPQMRAEAARAGRDDPRFTRGLMASPWPSCAPPRSDYEEIHLDGDLSELAQPLVVDRPVFIDGSALWPNNPEARRAGWAIIMIDEHGKLAGAIYGHLPWGEADEQTAGHAEMYALRRAAELAVGDLCVYTDYQEAAEGLTKGEAATTSPGMKHAAHWRAFWRAIDGSAPRVLKVKGHVTEAEVAHDADLKWRRAGNSLADKLAKKGARAHYVGDQWAAAKETAKRQDDHADLCTWIGAALSEWADEKRVRRREPDRKAMLARRRQRRDAARLVGGHRIAWGRDGWKCQDCGMQARSQSGARKLAGRPCPGHIATRIPDQAENGAAAHVLWTAEADDLQGPGGANVTWCSVCGAYSSTKLYKLAGRCSGPAEKAALTRLRALRGLRHPVLGYRLAKPHRMTDGLKSIMERQAAERKARYAEAIKVGSSGQPEGDAARIERAAEGGADDGSEEDIFGHGGGLDEDRADLGGDTDRCGEGANSVSRTVPNWPVADNGGPRAVPVWPVAGDTDRADEDDSGMYVDNPALCVVPMGLTTGSADPRAVPRGPAAGYYPTDVDEGAMGGTGSTKRRATERQNTGSGTGPRVIPQDGSETPRRGTRVLVWTHQYGAWRWTPASENCGGAPCICDLQLSRREIRQLMDQRGLTTAAQAQDAEAEEVMRRHRRRWAERTAMTNEDADAASRRNAENAAGTGSAKKRRVGAASNADAAVRHWAEVGHTAATPPRIEPPAWKRSGGGAGSARSLPIPSRRGRDGATAAAAAADCDDHRPAVKRHRGEILGPHAGGAPRGKRKREEECPRPRAACGDDSEWDGEETVYASRKALLQALRRRSNSGAEPSLSRSQR